jgi:hypothetical protein
MTRERAEGQMVVTLVEKRVMGRPGLAPTRAHRQPSWAHPAPSRARLVTSRTRLLCLQLKAPFALF